jgi:hypothetical protein
MTNFTIDNNHFNTPGSTVSMQPAANSGWKFTNNTSDIAGRDAFISPAGSGTNCTITGNMAFGFPSTGGFPPCTANMNSRNLRPLLPDFTLAAALVVEMVRVWARSR